MAWIGFNTSGFELERGIGILQESLKAALDALEQKHQDTVREYEDYEVGVAAGTIEREGEWEDGVQIWEKSQFYDFDLEVIAETVRAVRKAHVVALYHHWERTIAAWARYEKALPEGVDKPHHGHLREALLKAEIVPHPRLNAVRDLNNALKHNSEDYGKKLLISWPELLPSNFKPRAYTNWYELITLTDSDLSVIAEALIRSGPSPFLSRNRFMEGLS